MTDTLNIDGLEVGPCMVRGYIERIAELEQQFSGPSLNLLSEHYKMWCDEQGLPPFSVDDQDPKLLTASQQEYLDLFGKLWDWVAEVTPNEKIIKIVRESEKW